MTDTIQVRIRRAAVSEYQSAYDDHSASWRSIEAKAQASVAVGGAFLGVAFGIVREPNGQITSLESVLLFLTLVLLVLAVLCSIGALWPREVKAKPVPSTEYLDDFLGEDPGDEELYWQDRLRAWDDAVSNVADALKFKADWVLAAQMLTGAAVVGFGLFLFLYFG